MLPLIRTLFDIALLQKGPESVPRSGVLLLMSLVLWLLAALTFSTLIETAGGPDFTRDVVNFVLPIACYYAVLQVFGHGDRMLPTLTALVGCGALMVLLFTAALITIGQLGGDLVIRALGMAYLIWSLAVEGHIIARAISRAFYIGVLVAFAIFVFQFTVLSLILPRS